MDGWMDNWTQILRPIAIEIIFGGKEWVAGKWCANLFISIQRFGGGGWRRLRLAEHRFCWRLSHRMVVASTKPIASNWNLSDVICWNRLARKPIVDDRDRIITLNRTLAPFIHLIAPSTGNFYKFFFRFVLLLLLLLLLLPLFENHCCVLMSSNDKSTTINPLCDSITLTSYDVKTSRRQRHRQTATSYIKWWRP